MSEDGGTLMAVVDEQRLGFVVWRRHQTARTSYCWTVGVALVPEARGRGWGTAAQRRLARYLFAHTQVNRIEAVTDVGNLAEQRALAKAGFTREGVLRGYAFKDGRWHDAVLNSILRADVDLIDEPDEQPQQPSSAPYAGSEASDRGSSWSGEPARQVRVRPHRGGVRTAGCTRSIVPLSRMGATASERARSRRKRIPENRKSACRVVAPRSVLQSGTACGRGGARGWWLR